MTSETTRLLTSSTVMSLESLWKEMYWSSRCRVQREVGLCCSPTRSIWVRCTFTTRDSTWQRRLSCFQSRRYLLAASLPEVLCNLHAGTQKRSIFLAMYDSATGGSIVELDREGQVRRVIVAEQERHIHQVSIRNHYIYVLYLENLRMSLHLWGITVEDLGQ
jgi:hypothetical protein